MIQISRSFGCVFQSIGEAGLLFVLTICVAYAMFCHGFCANSINWIYPDTHGDVNILQTDQVMTNRRAVTEPLT
jgi:hypothetical protein